MASEAGICSLALNKVGGSNIISLTEGSRNANLCADEYPNARDQLLGDHDWNFAASRVKLAQLTAAPVYEFDHAYRLPADFIRLIAAHDNEAGAGVLDYRLEGDDGGQLLLSSADQVWVRYVRRVTDPNQMPPSFKRALAFELAVRLAVPIANSRTLREDVDRGAAKTLRKARSIDALQDRPEAFPDGSWIAARDGL